MHHTAMIHGKLFFDTYVEGGEGLTIVDIGAQDINGSLRSVAPRASEYVGVDFEPGKGVDVVITDPYRLPFPDNSVDVCVSSSCFEHSEFFWLTFLEVLRVMKPAGLLYMNAPSNGHFHRHPVDCWRFYPDSGIALQNWARRNGQEAVVLESFIGMQQSGIWNDFVAVLLKDQACLNGHPNRIIPGFAQFTNGRLHGRDDFLNFSQAQEDQKSASWVLKKKLQRALRLPL